LTEPTIFNIFVHDLFDDNVTTTNEGTARIDIIIVDDNNIVVVGWIWIGGWTTRILEREEKRKS
jgi:hypothetical protein